MAGMSTRSRISLKHASPARQARALQPRVSVPAADGGSSPIVKWAGGKSKLLEALVARAPDSYRRYFEPFLGGAALYFRMSPARAVLSDCNADLINMYRCVAWHVEAVIRRLARHRTAHSEAHYYEVREQWNTPGGLTADVDRAAAFI